MSGKGRIGSNMEAESCCEELDGKALIPRAEARAWDNKDGPGCLVAETGFESSAESESRWREVGVVEAGEVEEEDETRDSVEGEESCGSASEP